MRRTLGVETNRPSRQTDRIGDLERQLLASGVLPDGLELGEAETQVLHARNAALAALRVWNDPAATFRTGGFSLMFVAAWNSLAVALLMRRNERWWSCDVAGEPITSDGVLHSLSTPELVERAFPGAERRGLRENVQDWVLLRNAAAHRHLPALDAAVIPLAQAGLLNLENAISDAFGDHYALADLLAVPLQLSGFRDPGVLASRRALFAALPVDVQSVLARAESIEGLLQDETYMLRVAFIPVVPASGRSPDSVAYFVRPGEVPEGLEEALREYVVLPKAVRTARPNLGAKQVVAAVQSQIPWRFTTTMHATATRTLKVRPDSGAADQSTTDAMFCEYVPAAKLHLYNEAWIKRLVETLRTPELFSATCGVPACPKPEHVA
ncbi:MAG TPA: DUF3644 domain-containing protein [Ilumatobacter sp.]|nr:DUF3644 domain-containing protein [Ilumatobacter sp.]